jgi:hypothetical protein
MTPSKRQKVILLGIVIIIALLIGIASISRPDSYLGSSGFKTTIINHTTLLFGIEISRTSTERDSVLNIIAIIKYAEMLAVLLIGVTVLAISRKE